MRCAIYIRVSTDKEEQKLSLENQKNLFYTYVADKNWDIFDLYVDVESGTTAKRKNLIRMIEDAKSKKFDAIMAKELSRLARNGALSYEIRDIAARNNIHIITLDNAINILEGNSQNFGLYAWLYEQESQRTSNRIKAALGSKARRGEFKGSIPPYGYRLQNSHLVVADDGTPDVVKHIFQMYLEGKGFDAIARMLTHEDVPTSSQVVGKKNAGMYWHGSSVKKILQNPHYIGDLVQNRQTTKSVTCKERAVVAVGEQIIVSNTHLALISREDFEAVQRHMEGRKRQQTKLKAKKHLFTNHLYCDDCGKSLWYVQNRKGYICGTYYKHGKRCCTQHRVNEAELVETILNDLRSMTTVLDEQAVMTKLESKLQLSAKQAERQLMSLSKQVERLKEEKKNFIRLLANGTISEDEYRDVIGSSNKEILKLQENVAQMEASQAEHVGSSNYLKLRKELRKIIGLNELTPTVLHRLVNKVVIKEDGSVKIYYKCAAIS